MGSPGEHRAERRRRFVRVAERQGWDVELVDEAQVLNFATLEEAMRAAEAAAPDWIEVGEITPATEAAPQHHRWRTLRRGSAGRYVPTGLAWGGPPRRPDPDRPH